MGAPQVAVVKTGSGSRRSYRYVNENCAERKNQWLGIHSGRGTLSWWAEDLSLFNKVSSGAFSSRENCMELKKQIDGCGWGIAQGPREVTHQREHPMMMMMMMMMMMTMCVCVVGLRWNKWPCLGGNAPCFSKRPEEGPGSCLVLGAVCTTFGCGALEPGREVDANTLKWFPKGGEGPPRELAEREWPLMVTIPRTPQPQRLHAFTRLKQQLEPVWGEHLFPFQIAS